MFLPKRSQTVLVLASPGGFSMPSSRSRSAVNRTEPQNLHGTTPPSPILISSINQNTKQNDSNNKQPQQVTMGCTQSQQVVLSQHGSAGIVATDVVTGIIQAFFSEKDFAKCIVRMETSRDTPIESVYKIDYEHELGRGAGGIVRKARHLVTGDCFAVKCLEKKRVNTTEEGLDQLRNEIALMCEIDHPNIVRIREVYESEDMLYIVQELCTGGELFDRLMDVDHFSEAESAQHIKKMASAISYLHEHGICHRDLKLENWLYTASGELVLIDFGLSKHFEKGQHLNDAVGTPYTVAPEIIRGDYDEKVDIWALGVLSYLLLSGETPFGGLDDEEASEVAKRISQCKLGFEPSYVWDGVSDSAKNFVRSLLTLDSEQRPTCKQIQKDAWIVNVHPRSSILLKPATVNAILGFRELSDFEKLQSEILSFTLFPEQVIELRKEFEKLDIEGDGEVSLVALRRAVSAAVDADVLEAAFNAIKLRREAFGIQWHEFLAAMISLAHVDERNMRLAFDRLDRNGKGYLTLGDVRYFGRLSPTFGDCCALSSDHPIITFADFKRVHISGGGNGIEIRC
eukprot:scaffold3759_cov169-Amphora_coffeaeformis.AAC.9